MAQGCATVMNVRSNTVDKATKSKLQTPRKATNIMSFTRTHRTALVFDADGVNDTPGARNRFNRLLESVNGQNIKVDTYTVNAPSQSTAGLQSGFHVDGSDADVAEDEDVFTQLGEAGYTMVLLARAV